MKPTVSNQSILVVAFIFVVYIVDGAIVSTETTGNYSRPNKKME